MTDTANVQTLNVVRHVRAEPNEHTIRILEQMLVMAKIGDLLHVVGAGECADGTTQVFCSEEFRQRSALGALEVVKHDVLHRTEI